jgi:phage repressor protein C with HTH and peptisase S24 domain
MEQTTINERIKSLVDYFSQGNKSAFARAAGISNQSLSEIIGQRGNAPSFSALQKIAQSFPDIREAWLLLGQGEMLKSEESKTEAQESLSYMTPHHGSLNIEEPAKRVQPTEKLRVLTVQVGPDGDENIELVPVWAAAGYVAHGTDTTFIEKLPSFRLPGAAFNNGSFRAFQVHGASMQGTLEDGDWIICRFVEKWAHDILDNRVYVVVSETDVLVKRVLNQINERGRLSLHSDNPSFDVQDMDWQEVREVWQGVARLTLDLTNTRLDVPTELAKLQAVTAEVLRRLDKLETPTL